MVTTLTIVSLELDTHDDEGPFPTLYKYQADAQSLVLVGSHSHVGLGLCSASLAYEDCNWTLVSFMVIFDIIFQCLSFC